MSSQRQTQSSGQQHHCFVNFSQIAHPIQSIRGSQDIENIIDRIEYQLRDSSNDMISEEIYHFNSKSSKVYKESSNCPISESFASISSRILSNYTNSLKQLKQMENRMSQKESEGNLQSSFNELEIFMKKYIAYTQLKYHNYYGDDQGGMMVIPDSKIDSLSHFLQQEVAKNNSEIRNKLNTSSGSDSINKSLSIQDVKEILKSQMQQLVKETETYFDKYQKLITKIDPQVKFRSKEYLSQLQGQNNIIDNSFKTAAKTSFITKLMNGMLTTLREKNKGSKTFYKSVKEEMFNSSLRQKDLNIKLQQLSIKQAKKQKKDLQSEYERKPKTNGKTQISIERLSEFSQQSLSFSQFYRKTQSGKNQNNNHMEDQEQLSWKQVRNMALNYSKYIYEQTFQKLARHLHLFIEEGSQSAQTIAALAQQALIKSEENLLMNAFIECDNQTLVNILKQINQLAVEKQILVLNVENNLRKENDHTIMVLFSITNKTIIPCRLKIRLDQRLSTKKILRQNFQMLGDFMEGLKNSPFGVPGQMALYCLANHKQ